MENWKVGDVVWFFVGDKPVLVEGKTVYTGTRLVRGRIVRPTLNGWLVRTMSGVADYIVPTNGWLFKTRRSALAKRYPQQESPK